MNAEAASAPPRVSWRAIAAWLRAERAERARGGVLFEVARATGRVLVVIGLTFLLFVFYMNVGTAAITHGRQAALSREFDLMPRVAPGPRSFAPADLVIPREGKPIGRLRIPKMHLSMIIVQGTTIEDLLNGPGHYMDTPMPGQPGSVGVAGHRTGWGSPFIDVDKLQPGDPIYIDTKYGTFTYRVREHRVVDPHAAWVLFGSPDSTDPYQLTLTSCTPKYTSLHRYIVWADQVDPAP